MLRASRVPKWVWVVLWVHTTKRVLSISNLVIFRLLLNLQMRIQETPMFLLCLCLTLRCYQLLTLNKLKQTGTKVHICRLCFLDWVCLIAQCSWDAGYQQWEAAFSDVPKVTWRILLKLDAHTSRIWCLVGTDDFYTKVRGRKGFRRHLCTWHKVNLYSMAGQILQVTQQCKISLIGHHGMTFGKYTSRLISLIYCAFLNQIRGYLLINKTEKENVKKFVR